MKAEFDKEIDSLLRERARRGLFASGEAGAPVGGSGGAHAAHLDADEQSAYAENALPAAARAHYAAHLADCDDCRRSVTRLALAAGLPAGLEPRETATAQAASPQGGWRERLGALLAPRAWRYAVPALALLLVGAVSLVVLMRGTQREEPSIAQRNATEARRATTPQSAPATQPEAHHAPNDNAASAIGANPGDADASPNSGASATNPHTPLTKEEIAANSERTGVLQSQPGAGGGNALPPSPAAPTSGGAVGSGGGAPVASDMPAPAPVVVDGITSASEREAKLNRGEPAPETLRGGGRSGNFENRTRDQLSGPRRNEQARGTRSVDATDAAARAGRQNEGFVLLPTPTPPPPPPAAASTSARAARRDEADRAVNENRAAEDSARAERGSAKSAAETRSVAGRKFRRQGDAWIDTAYRAGQSATIVRRNSEQFRALVADEPELRRIADALGGEVFVVWKGRAYRIR